MSPLMPIDSPRTTCMIGAILVKVIEMYVTINHIPVADGRETDFEALWHSREGSIEGQPGFVSLDILKPGMKMTHGGPPEKQDNTYHVMTRWESEEAFLRWVGSEDFRRAHDRKVDKTIYGGPALVTMHATIEGAGA